MPVLINVGIIAKRKTVQRQLDGSHILCGVLYDRTIITYFLYYRRKTMRKRFLTLGLAILMAVSFTACGGNDKKEDTTKKTTEAKKTQTEKTTEKEADENVPTEYKSALSKAESYSDNMHMSKQGIYDQLVSEYGEKFSKEAADYAMENISADWNKNALKKAESYSDSMHMSKKGIYDQLTSDAGEKFTAEEAQYAIDHIKADWNKNALEKAKNYQETMDMSPEAIRDQLTSEYGEQFTAEEADYAVKHLE